MHDSALYERFIKALACLINFTNVQLIAYLLNAYILYISLREHLINVDMTGSNRKTVRYGTNSVPFLYRQ